MAKYLWYITMFFQENKIVRADILVPSASRNESFEELEENIAKTTTTTTMTKTTTTTSTIQIKLTTVIENNKEIHHEHGLKINQKWKKFMKRKDFQLSIATYCESSASVNPVKNY